MFRTTTTLAAWLAVSSLIFATGLDDQPGQDEKGKGKGKKRGENPGVAQMFAMPETITLSDDQKAKLAELKSTYAPKIIEASMAMEKVLTPEQKKARREAMASAKAAGRKGKELRDEAGAAMNLTDEQKTKLNEAENTLNTLRTEVRGKIMDMLTPEQKAMMPNAKGKKGKKKNA